MERFDRWNQRQLEKHNRMDKPLVSPGAERLLTWYYGTAIVVLVALLVVAVVGSIFT